MRVEFPKKLGFLFAPGEKQDAVSASLAARERMGLCA